MDVPVVSGDAIKNSLASGFPPLIASWLGPTKLITAIIFATITNIVAYLPFLTLPGSIFYTIQDLSDKAFLRSAMRRSLERNAPCSDERGRSSDNGD